VIRSQRQSLPGWRLLRSRLGAILAIAFAVTALSPGPAPAQSTYPSKPIRIVVGFAAGGPADIIARVVGAKLGDILGQQVYIENRTGAGGTIATEAVARAEGDGYTLLATPLANAVNETLFKNLKYKVGEHLAAVASIAETANVLVVHPSLEVNSVSELVALAKAKPGEYFTPAPEEGLQHISQASSLT
jgi:tripartite-type tricarboxylate transporter receptor subunit TctC